MRQAYSFETLQMLQKIAWLETCFTFLTSIVNSSVIHIPGCFQSGLVAPKISTKNMLWTCCFWIGVEGDIITYDQHKML